MMQVGYTAGQRGSEQIGWAKNLLRTIDATRAEEAAYKISSLFARVWPQLRYLLPDVIQEDLEAAILN